MAGGVDARKAPYFPFWLIFLKKIEQSGEYSRKSEEIANSLVENGLRRGSITNGGSPLTIYLKNGVDLSKRRCIMKLVKESQSQISKKAK